ncbi:Ribose 1,5-bisphosphate phosphokinase PhnN [Andreprevotia sp. IGB-42]|uniref:phosphonate metabolism protein/1,5-bisphosphokinase (PRPP-forming) PhnN n=1 Tax=Andreprevotia sp. IGB-42 TaxID=2497473 RepID=UPI001359BC32|nr:phosphonate metabolism protein/1,5-bisphosphokinase (PRPP-forming) PhnN [Andreprevotia sp. IGB-42]KAF0813872.1 Ribose 1,5-bisphosphate phosphokinase PhnN [Andreprevotia sp. IGB-42]
MSGRLIIVLGASGVGKDSVIAYARSALDNRHAVRTVNGHEGKTCIAAHGARAPQVRFAQRYITRPAAAGGEAHREMNADEFALWLAHDRFALWWQSHGLQYGIGTEIDAWLAGGVTVVVNGSRANIAAAQQRYPELEVALFTATPATLAARLAARGRESGADIATRLARSTPPLPDTISVHEIANDGALEAAGEQFLALLLGQPG